MKTADIVMIGSGSLATKIVHALSQISLGPMRIVIVGRSTAKISRLAVLANARAAILRHSTSFLPVHLPEFTALAFSRLFRSVKPKVIVHTASLQSPWEGSEAKNAWPQLLASAGFGITLPLQLSLIAEVSRGASDTWAAIINASYPDAVNVVLNRLGLEVACGIGNATIVEAFCRARAQSPKDDVRVLGHHGHLSVWLRGESSRPQPRVWKKAREIEATRLRPALENIDEELNQVTAATAIPVIMALLTGSSLQISIPGVAGLPGGYPYLLRRRKFTSRLPAGISRAQAIAHNRTGEQLDGIELNSSGVKFIGDAQRGLRSVGFEYSQGFDFTEWPAACQRMLALRERLRVQAP